jgi:hypothetical protein
MARSGWKIWQVSFLPFFAVVVVITIALATLTYYLVERPCQNLARDWARRWRNRPSRGPVPAAASTVPPARAVPAPETAPTPTAPAPGSPPAPIRAGALVGAAAETTVPPRPEPRQPDRIGGRHSVSRGGGQGSGNPAPTGRGSGGQRGSQPDSRSAGPRPGGQRGAGG